MRGGCASLRTPLSRRVATKNKHHASEGLRVFNEIQSRGEAVDVLLSMSNRFRFHRYRRPFDHGLRVGSPIKQGEAATLFAARDLERLLRGSTWLAIDLAARCLHSRDLPAPLGEELAVAALDGMFMALRKMRGLPGNFAAFMSAVAESAMIEYMERRPLIRVPPRTRRDRAAKDKLPAVAPQVQRILYGDDNDDKKTAKPDAVWAVFAAAFGLRHPEDIYPFCAGQLERDLIVMRYDGGAGPRCLNECAGVLEISFSRAKRMLDDIEERVYRALERRKPRGRRHPGTRRHTLKKVA
jgi:hypothetical protein